MNDVWAEDAGFHSNLLASLASFVRRPILALESLACRDHARRGPATSTESLGCSPRDRPRSSRSVVAGPPRRIEARFVYS